ncbi:MAG: glycine zipper 2TM domain-containing protein [Proteobacteria bacterium]|nr:glycine zipper 2TM domain-containing protein [Pseudomonadota bacterium]
MQPRYLAASLLFLALALAGCAPPYRGDVYGPGQTMRAQSVELGVIEGLRPVVVQAPNSGVGTVGGAALGGIAGAQIGGSSAANAAGAVAGAIIGGLAGNAIESNANTRNGVEVTVRLDSGRMIAIVQQDGGEQFRVGDRVRVLSDGYTTRVSRL